MPAYKLTLYDEPTLKTLGKTFPDRKEIHINSAVTPAGFEAYFLGEIQSKSSAQKKEVLSLLENQGFSWKKIRSLLPNVRLIRRFLILHELSHINHNDGETYHTCSLEEQIKIETRACLEALIQINLEAAKL